MSDYTSLLFNPKIGAWTFKFMPVNGGKRTAKNVPRAVARDRGDEARARKWVEKAIIVYRNTGMWPGADVRVPPTLPVVTLKALGPKWIEWLRERNAGGEGAATTTDGYAQLLSKSLYEHPLGQIPIQQVSVDDACAFVEDVSKGCEANTGRNRAAAVTALFKWARSRDARPWMGPVRVPANPMRDELVRSLIPNKGSRAARENIIVALPRDRFESLVTHPSSAISPFRRVWYVCAITSGMRFAEQAGLPWMHLHFRGERCARTGCQAPAAIPHLHVDRQVTRRCTFTPPKRGSIRTLPLHPLAIETLAWWHAVGWRLHVGRAPTATDPVFPRAADGTFVYHQHLARALRADLVEAELSAKVDGFNLDIHSLRRAFLTMLADAGVEESIRVVLGGHRAKTVTDRHYTARNLPRLVPAVHALQFERVAGVSAILPELGAQRVA